MKTKPSSPEMPKRLAFVSLSLHLSLFFSLSLLLVSCGSKSPKSATPKSVVSEETYFLHGDPKNIIAGATLNPQSFISVNNYESFNGYALTNIVTFAQKKLLVKTKERTTPEEGNEASSSDDTKTRESIEAHQFIYDAEKNLYVYPFDGITFVFAPVKESLELIGLLVEDEIIQVHPLHYSLKNSKNSFSILVEAKEGNDTNVFAFYFNKKETIQPIPLIEGKYLNQYDYNYLMGPGVGVRWSQAQLLTLDICGTPSLDVQKLYEEAFSKWAPLFKDRLKIKLRVPKTYPPFSDLNSQCIYTVDNYLTETNPRFINPATTYSVPQIFEGILADADIFVWVKENERQLPNLFKNNLFLKEYLSRTILHELGHFFGLDHQFNETINSIMSYKTYDKNIESYDQKAIENLYPMFQSPNFNLFGNL